MKLKNRSYNKLDMLMLTLLCFGAYIQPCQTQSASNLTKIEGENITLTCLLTGSYTFPEWSGPPQVTIYFIQGDSTINPAAPAADRLTLSSNNKDLILHDAVQGDSGDYKCSYSGIGDHTVTLTVTQATTTATTTTPTPTPGTITTEGPCWCWCRLWLCILIIFIIIICCLYLCGIVIGIFMYCCKNGPCKKFYVGDRIPKWVKRLQYIIVGLGILTVHRICKRCGRFNDNSTQNEMSMNRKK